MTFEELKREGQFRFARFRLDTLLPTIAPFLPHAPSSWGPEVEALRRTVEEEKARAGINPRDWYRCPHDVDLKHLSLEVWDGGKWKPSPLSATVLLVENECRTGV